MRNWCRRAILALMLLHAPLCAVAGTLYSNLGPGNSFIINREYDTNVTYLETPFVTTAAGKLGSVLTPVFSLDSPISFGLYADSSGRAGSLLESWSVPVPGVPGQLVTLNSTLNPFLAAGTQYWFVITQAKPSEVAWYWNNQNVAGGIWAGPALDNVIEFTPASPIPALRLDTVASVPEPAAAVAFGGGLSLSALTCMRRRCQAKISGFSP